MVKLEPEVDYPVSYARDADELKFFVHKAIELGYLEAPEGPGVLVRLDVKGWEKVIELQANQSRPDQAFVAMWFSPDMNDAFEHGIAKALDATGYTPLRIDMSEHNDKIDDRIISEIRRSGLVVADFTGQRGGVYFEAGFAMGLGIPLIWTCREDEVDKLHFDTRQYNHIVWSDADDLRQKLQYRIEATHPRANGLIRQQAA
jgi:nucleoside 2-deoxyribosyltransferase